ncbi:plasmid replication protein RepC [Methylobacterium sp. GC_Met_2]|uniref:plasmid replication protein RepC n=1 Tax=Methylobacterium sp. GC_Met_2 TaxID=2937376 RepID=UPI00226B77C7|nr:plasmid replication protein RepC [Methylobacterium sp. GC_Met_2]
MSLHITTPFGRRSLTAAQFHAQAQAAGCPNETTVNKWSVFRDLAAARSALGLSDRALAVLDALLTFHPETTLSPGEGCELVVFPSNTALALRAHGMAEASLRRHLAALVEAGIVIRRDSPNGKRYVRRGQTGAVTQAFGFDLSPLVARACEFAVLAEAIREAARTLRVAREQVTLLRRDCAKLILALEEVEGGTTSAGPLRSRYRAILDSLPRSPSSDALSAAAAGLADLRADLSKLLSAHWETAESSGNAAQNDRHNQSSNPESPDYEKATGEEEKKAVAAGPIIDRPAVDAARVRATYPLGFVLDACPDIQAYARGEIRTWNELISVADLARAAMGISPHAWREARTEMGEDVAAITVAAILQRVERISSPGGYLRSLVERKKAGRYSLGPVLQALNRAKLGSLAVRQ